SRYLSPLTPLLALCLVQSLVTFRAWSLRHWPPRWQRWSSAGVALLLTGVLATEAFVDFYALKVRHEQGLTYAGQQDGSDSRLFYYGQTWRAFDAALAWLKGQARPGEVVATSSPHWAYLHTGLRAVMPPMEADLPKGQRLLDSVPATYVIIDELE